MAKTPRELAYHILLTAERDKQRFIDEALNKALDSSPLKQAEKSWITELVYGVTRMKFQLDTYIEKLYRGRYKKAQHSIKTLLRMGAYQLMHMRTQTHAAINETVELARKTGNQTSASLVNAILRMLGSDATRDTLATIQDPLKILAVEYSLPEWMIHRWSRRLEASQVEALCQWNNSIPNHWVRYNLSQITDSEFENFLSEQKVNYTRSDVLSQFYRLDSLARVLQSEEFRKGWFSVQNIAAGLVASLIEPEEGDIIIDACAAPGGKSAYIMEKHGDRIRSFYAFDLSAHRIGLLKDTLQRLKLTKVRTEMLDAAVDDLPMANKILIDVPCTGTGVLNRRPDARWKKSESDLLALNEIQAAIFKNAWKHLLPDGYLIYATCSLEPEENWQLIDSVIDDLDGARIVPVTDEKLQAFIDERGALATLPWVHNMDGMFSVGIKKI